MYQYNETDQTLIDERVAQFKHQTERFLNGEIAEDHYRSLRLMNGIYIQTHAPMLRVAGPYGLLSSNAFSFSFYPKHKSWYSLSSPSTLASFLSIIFLSDSAFTSFSLKTGILRPSYLALAVSF